MKGFIFSIILFISAGCSKRLVYLNGTSQQWSINSSKESGVVYHFLLKAKEDHDKLRIDSLAIEKDIIHKFKVTVIGQSNSDTNYLKNDSILISVNVLTNKINNQTTNPQKIFIFYNCHHMNHKLKINDIKILNPL